MGGNIGKLLLGNGLGQVIQFLSILLFSRIYSPSDFGALGQVQSYSTAVAIICTLQMHLSIPLSKSILEARNIVSATVLTCLLVGIIGLPVAFYFGHVYVFALALAVFIGLANTFNGFLIFGGNFGNISRFYILRAFCIVVLQTGFGLSGYGDGLVWGAVAGEGLTAVYLGIRTRNLNSLRKTGGIQNLLAVITEKRAFAIYGTLQELASVCAFYAPLFFFAAMYSDAVVGQYAMASRLIWAPIILFTGSLAQVLYHDFGKNVSVRQVSPSFLKLPHIAYYPLLFIAPLLCFILKDVVVLVLGAKWRLAADFLPLVLAWGCIFVASTPSRVICRMLGQQRSHLMIDVGMLAGIAAIFYWLNGSPIQVMLGILLVTALQNSLMFFTAYRAIRVVQS